MAISVLPHNNIEYSNSPENTISYSSATKINQAYDSKIVNNNFNFDTSSRGYKIFHSSNITTNYDILKQNSDGISKLSDFSSPSWAYLSMRLSIISTHGENIQEQNYKVPSFISILKQTSKSRIDNLELLESDINTINEHHSRFPSTNTNSILKPSLQLNFPSINNTKFTSQMVLEGLKQYPKESLPFSSSLNSFEYTDHSKHCVVNNIYNSPKFVIPSHARSISVNPRKKSERNQLDVTALAWKKVFPQLSHLESPQSSLKFNHHYKNTISASNSEEKDSFKLHHLLNIESKKYYSSKVSRFYSKRTEFVLENKITCPLRVPGVWFDNRRSLWRAMYLEGDKRKTKGFSVKDYNYEEARKRAIDWRLQQGH